MTISRRTFVAGGVGAVALTRLGSPALAQSSTTIRFGPTTTDISTGHAAHSSLPQALGFWKDEGLDVDVFGVAGSTTGMQMVSGGQMEFVTITAEEMLFARANGMPVKTGYQLAQNTGRAINESQYPSLNERADALAQEIIDRFTELAGTKK